MQRLHWITETLDYRVHRISESCRILNIGIPVVNDECLVTMCSSAAYDREIVRGGFCTRTSH